MKIALGAIIGGFLVYLFTWLTTPQTLSEAWDKGYADGYKKALITTPPSDELESACVSLWFGNKGQEYWKLKGEIK